MKGIKAVEEQIKLACSDGNWNYDPYMHGMADGLICALATIKEEDPIYLSAPEKWLYDFPSPEKPDGVMAQNKPATILYKKLPDNMILITGFENFLTILGIQEKYGFKVVNIYCTYPDHMSMGSDCIHTYGNHVGDVITIGTMYSKDNFSKIIAHVKKCGGLLHDIIAAVDSGEVKQIKI